MRDNLQLEGKIGQGYGIASGLAVDNPFPKGSLELQASFFKERGFDLEEMIPDLYWGTLNVDLSPKKVAVINPDYIFKNVCWIDTIDPETFSFVAIILRFKNRDYKGFVYYPHPETKPNVCDHNYSCLEIICEHIPAIEYGDQVSLNIRKNALNFIED